MLEEDVQKYQEAKMNLEFESENTLLIQDYTHRLQTEMIPCYKYAYSLDHHNCSESLIQLSKDEDELIILNKKVVGKVIHVVEQDPREVERL